MNFIKNNVSTLIIPLIILNSFGFTPKRVGVFYFKENFGNLDDIRKKLTPNYYKFGKDLKLVPEHNCKQDSIYHKSSNTHGKGTVSCRS